MFMKKSITTAKIWKRVLAFVIDVSFFMLVINRPFLAVYFPLMGVTADDMSIGYFIANSQFEKTILTSSFVSLILLLAYFSATEAVLGATLGKYLLGIKVINLKGEKPSLVQAILRNIPKTLIPIFVIDIMGLFGPNRQRISEKLVGTYVVNITGGKNE